MTTLCTNELLVATHPTYRWRVFKGSIRSEEHGKEGGGREERERREGRKGEEGGKEGEGT